MVQRIFLVSLLPIRNLEFGGRITVMKANLSHRNEIPDVFKVANDHPSKKDYVD